MIHNISLLFLASTVFFTDMKAFEDDVFDLKEEREYFHNNTLPNKRSFKQNFDKAAANKKSSENDAPKKETANKKAEKDAVHKINEEYKKRFDQYRLDQNVPNKVEPEVKAVEQEVVKNAVSLVVSVAETVTTVQKQAALAKQLAELNKRSFDADIEKKAEELLKHKQKKYEQQKEKYGEKKVPTVQQYLEAKYDYLVMQHEIERRVTAKKWFWREVVVAGASALGAIYFSLRNSSIGNPGTMISGALTVISGSCAINHHSIVKGSFAATEQQKNEAVLKMLNKKIAKVQKEHD